MDLVIKARHFELPDNLKEFIERKMRKLLRYSQRIDKAEVILEWNYPRYFVEINLHTRHEWFNSKAEGTNSFETVFEHALKKMERQITDYEHRLKEKP